ARPRPSLVPKIRLAPGENLSRAKGNWPGSPHIAALMAAHDLSPEGEEVIDDALPACQAPLNPPRDGPRLRVLRGGVWW
ncbi:MAG: hypothetical protein KJ796_10665, partial [Alphaproteobacteria bacterium]|nr:hypothetical protein [Alphaproteobacteria bacterium]